MHHKAVVEFSKLSTKQLTCECLDIITKCLGEALALYQTKAKLDLPLESDLPRLISLILERYDAFLDALDVKAMSDRLLLKSWLHEIKYIRNEWAHNSAMDQRLMVRLYDTGDLLFIKLRANLHDPLYQRLTFFRNHLVMQEAVRLQNAGFH